MQFHSVAAIIIIIIIIIIIVIIVILSNSRHVNILRKNTTFFKNMFQQNILSSLDYKEQS